MIKITSTKEFIEKYQYYGYENFIKDVVKQCKHKEYYGLIGKLTLTDAEPDNRVYFENEIGEKFKVRYFIEENNKFVWKACYGVYKMGDDSSDYDLSLHTGYAISHYIINYNKCSNSSQY